MIHIDGIAERLSAWHQQRTENWMFSTISKVCPNLVKLVQTKQPYAAACYLRALGFQHRVYPHDNHQELWMNNVHLSTLPHVDPYKKPEYFNSTYEMPYMFFPRHNSN